MRAKFGFAVLCAVLLACVGCTAKSGRSGLNPVCICGVPGNEQDLVANVGDRVFFQFGRSGLSGDSDTTLKRQSAWLVKYPTVNVLVAGNSDERGTETYNLALGQRRADVVRDYLMAQGVAASRITTVSYGKDCPVAPGHDEDSYEQDRNAIMSVAGFNPQICR
jgi:peptidoglycan-associated lipoprotein